jgi:hypothetical protein
VLSCAAALSPERSLAQGVAPPNQAGASAAAEDQGQSLRPAQSADAPGTQEQIQAAVLDADDLAPSKALRPGNVGTIAESTAPGAVLSSLLPELSGPTVAWMAVVVILLLTLGFKPLLSWHNLDGLVLALTALLLSLRSSLSESGDPGGQTAQWWTYLLLCLGGAYWLVRGLQLLFARPALALQPNVSEGAMLVLVVAGLFVAGSRIAHAPLSDGSRDGLVGGIYTAETGKLPYGDAIGHDARSPLMYLTHAGAVKLMKPTVAAGAELRWEDRATWLDAATLETLDPTAARLVNALLFALFLAALAGIGHRLHSVAAAQTLVVIACVFPGVLECASRPEIMLPTVLLSWSLAFALLPGLGGLLAVLTMVFAALAWPWAWLMLPALLAYFLRRRLQTLGALAGLLIGLAATVLGMTTLVAPALPRADGALREAGITPEYAARLSNDGTPIIERYQPSETVVPTLRKHIWTPMIGQDEVRLDSASTQPALPNGVDAAAVRYRDVAASGPAREALQREYRAALSREPRVTQALASLRTLLEATWKPAITPALPVVGVWDLWAVNRPVGPWTLTRRIAKVAVGLLALLVAFVLIRGRPKQLQQLIGALLALGAATLLISYLGAATNWVWVMPTALAALASRDNATAPPPEIPARRRPPVDLGPAPRITVER